MIKSAPALTSA